MTAVVCQRTSVRVSAPDGIHLSRKGFDSRRICLDGCYLSAWKQALSIIRLRYDANICNNFLYLQINRIFIE